RHLHHRAPTQALHGQGHPRRGDVEMGGCGDVLHAAGAPGVQADEGAGERKGGNASQDGRPHASLRSGAQSTTPSQSSHADSRKVIIPNPCTSVPTCPEPKPSSTSPPTTPPAAPRAAGRRPVRRIAVAQSRRATAQATTLTAANPWFHSPV